MNPPGTMCPWIFGGGNVSGKFRTVDRRPASVAIDHIVGHATSCDVRNRNRGLDSLSLRKKSKMPWDPGPRPVTSEVHAGGVNAGTVDFSVARAPEPIRS